MTPEQIKLVQETFESVQPIAAQAADLFYGRRLEIAPQVRPLFPEDLAKQTRKLMGTRHRGHQPASGREDRAGRAGPGAMALRLGVTEAPNAPVGEALIWTLDKGLGPAFTPEVKDARLGAYTTLAGVMKDAAQAAKPAQQGLLARVLR